jgi:hypothetical protein
LSANGDAALGSLGCETTLFTINSIAPRAGST